MSDNNDASRLFSSRAGLILSVLGIAVGTGNIWRFPRIVAQNGGEDGAGAFLVAWLVFLFVWSVPLIIAEYALGRAGRMGVVGTFGRIAGKRFAWMGGFVGLVATAIMFYYAVVAGWCLYYAGRMLLAPLPSTATEAAAVWDGFQGSWGPFLLHATAVALGGLAVLKGVRSIERVSQVLIPILLAIVLLAVARALTLDGAAEGIRYLFIPDWSTLMKPSLWLDALTQNAWDTGAGWGLILTYATYMQKRHGVVKNAFLTGIGNNVVSLLAATMIFGTVFALLGAQMDNAAVLEVMRTSGPASTGLTFIWMPQLFAEMPFGRVPAFLFFLGLAFAAYTSLVSMVELAVRILVDAGMKRKNAILAVVAVAILCGYPSVRSLTFLGNQDFVWGVALMISGAFVAFAVYHYGVSQFRRDCVEGSPGDWRAGVLWERLIAIAVPVQAAVLLAWWLYIAATEYAPDTWYNPIEPYSVMTCLVQWGAALLALFLANGFLIRRTFGARQPD